MVCAVNAYSRFTMQPPQGHMDGIIRVFGYLKKFKKGKIKEENALGRVGKDWSKRAGAEGICSAGGVGSQRKRGGVN